MKTLGTIVMLAALAGGCASQSKAKKAAAPEPAAAPAATPPPSEAVPVAPPAAAPGASTEGKPDAKTAKPSEPDAPGSPGMSAKSDAGKAKKGARVVDGRPLVLVGQGARVKEGEKLYDMQMWIDEEDGRRAFPALAMRAGGRDKARLVRGDHAPGFLVWGRFTKVAVFKFTKPVSGAAMRDDLKGVFEDVKGADAVEAMFAEDADAGDEWVLTTRDNGEIELKTGDGKDGTKEGPQSPKLQRALWNVWLGAKPLSVELRRSLIEKINLLGQ